MEYFVAFVRRRKGIRCILQYYATAGLPHPHVQDATSRNPITDLRKDVPKFRSFEKRNRKLVNYDSYFTIRETGPWTAILSGRSAKNHFEYCHQAALQHMSHRSNDEDLYHPPCGINKWYNRYVMKNASETFNGIFGHASR